MLSSSSSKDLSRVNLEWFNIQTAGVLVMGSSFGCDLFEKEGDLSLANQPSGGDPTESGSSSRVNSGPPHSVAAVEASSRVIEDVSNCWGTKYD